MKIVNILRAMLKLAEFFGEVRQVHLYEGGVIAVEGAGYSLHFIRKASETAAGGGGSAGDH